MNINPFNLAAATFLCAVIPAIASAASISGQGTWETTLQGRDLDGDLSTAEAYYDTVLDITWLADANYAQTSGYDTDGLMSWETANTWTTSLTIGGVSGWRLPFTDGRFEMDSLFFSTLGNTSDFDFFTPHCPVSGCLVNTGPFSNMQPQRYWSEEGTPPGSLYAWNFNFNTGLRSSDRKFFDFYGWAVHSGDVGVALPSAVPVPAAAWLFGSGLLGLVGLARKRRT